MRVLGRYMKMPAKPRKKPMSLSAFKKKVGSMLETISRLETTERTEAYGYLQNSVNVLGIHKLGLSQADIANLIPKPTSTNSTKDSTKESVKDSCFESSLAPVKTSIIAPDKEIPKESHPVSTDRNDTSKELKSTPSVSSSIQVSVISRNERANVINFSKSDNSNIVKHDIQSQSNSLESYLPSDTVVSQAFGSQSKLSETSEDSYRKSVVLSTIHSRNVNSSEVASTSPCMESEQSTEYRNDLNEKSFLGTCTECGIHLKSRRAMLAHLDRHVSIPVSCRACCRSFGSLSALKFHYEDFCVSKSLVCPQCDEVFSCRTHFNNHVEGHYRNNCQLCPALFTNRKNLVVHMADAHNIVMLADAAFVCTYEGCERRFVKRSTLHRHMQLRHAAQGQLVCITCGMFCDGEDEYAAHTETHKQWTCEECSESFTRRQQYLVHLSSHETSKYRCVTCNQVLPTKARVLEHRKDGHQVEGLSVDFACDKCDQRFHTSAELRDHSHIHKPLGAIFCKFCHKTFSTKKICHSHMRSQHGIAFENGREASLICDQCGKQFRSPSLLSKHIKGVHNEQVFTCTYCDHKTNNEVNMRRHQALHTSQEQQYVCDQCGASFQALSTLKDHNLFVHSDERNFTCNVCNKSFKRRNDLRRHSRSHSNERQYVCHCKQSYKFMSHLRRHQEAAHKSVPNSRKVVRLVEDATGNLVEKQKPVQEKKVQREKKEIVSRVEVSKMPEQFVDIQPEESAGQYTAAEDDQVVTMSVQGIPITDEQVDPYSLQVSYDGLNYTDPKTQLVYTTPTASSHVMSLQLPQFELVEPLPYDSNNVMDMTTASHADMGNAHSSMLMSIAASEPSSQPVMTLITGLEQNTLFTTQADIGTMTEHSDVYSESLLHHTHSPQTATDGKPDENFTEVHVLDPKSSSTDINTISNIYNVYESPSNMCVTQHPHHHHHNGLTSLSYPPPLDPCHSILLPPDQAWHLHQEASNLAQYSTC